jgi:gluconokinase
VGTPDYLIALDIGTTSTKGMLYRIHSGVIAVTSKGYPQYYPNQGFVEQDPDEILNAVESVVKSLVQEHSVKPSSVAAVVYGSFLHSMLPVDKNGDPLARALIWADSRSTPQSERLRAELDVEEVKRRTGCTVHPLYFLPRLMWFRDNAQEVFRKTDRFVSVKEYIIHRLHGESVVDRSIASGTGIFNVTTLDWDSELLHHAGFDSDYFSPPVEPTYALKGITPQSASRLGLLDGTPGIIGASDGPLAHLGSTGLMAGIMSLTVGTSGALRMSIGSPRIIPHQEAWCYYLAENNWVLGAVCHDTGIVMNWFLHHFLKGKDFGDMNTLAREVEAGSEGLLFFPFLGGEKSPHYNPTARGALVGMSFVHDIRHIVRALMEGISYRLYTNYRMLDRSAAMELALTGGIRSSPVWMQITADFFGKNLKIPKTKECAAWGAAMIGLRSLGILKKLHDVGRFVEYGPSVDYNKNTQSQYRKIYSHYEDMYRKIFQ